MIKKSLPFLVLFILFSACENNAPPADFLQQDIPVAEKIKKLLEPAYAHKLGIDEPGRKLLRGFYKQRQFAPLWSTDSVLTETGIELKRILHTPVLLGLPAKRYKQFKWSKNHLENELVIAAMLAIASQDLRYGLLDTLEKAYKPIAYGSADQLKALYNFPKAPKAIAEKLILLGPADSTYQEIAHGLFTFASTHPLREKQIQVPTMKADSSAAVFQARKVLIAKGYLPGENADSLQYDTAIRLFQKHNGQKDDAVIGENTALALMESNLTKCRRAALALEKWRWKKAFPDKFIWVNIPEYKLRFFINDSLKSENRIVVGKFENQTPEFEAKLRAIIAFPYWNVPFSITSKEFLPSAKSNPGYFARNHMKLYQKGLEIDPLSVAWRKIRDKTFPYKVTQDPGPWNSLGIIKFEFSNKYGVYVHDTPSKGLFNTTIRSYSHGCVRCEHPVQLGKLILLRDDNHILPDSLDSILSRGVNRPIQLKRTIPIYLDYISVVPDWKGGILFLKDIYKRDEKYIAYLF
jgi:murein L,D-transpeptidase YcbB/YkuD